MLSFQELPLGAKVKIHLSKNDKYLDMDATIVSHLENSISILNISYPTKKRLNFNGLSIHVDYDLNNTSILRFLRCKIVYYRGYNIQVSDTGVIVRK